jgi:DNA-binding NarL/FixJ family response regulator
MFGGQHEAYGAVRVLVVEGDRRVRDAIAHLLDRTRFSADLVGSAAAALAALEDDPQVVLVDLGLPDLDGIELIAQIRAQRPTTPCLVLTSASTENQIRAALRAGARGYLLKEDLGRRLVLAISEALLGGIPLSKVAAELLLAQVRGDAPPPPSSGEVVGGPLSARERQVLARLARSLTYEETAADLGVSVNTVRTYVRGIYDKLAVSSRTEAVMAALERGLLPHT